jgi:hypothetical protein
MTARRKSAAAAQAARKPARSTKRGTSLADVRAMALALPGTEELPHREYTSFRVRGRIYATAPPEGGFLHVFVDEETRAAAIGLAPEAVEALHWGAKVVGVRLNLARVSAARVERLLDQAWTMRAPKAVVAARNAAAAS